MRDDKIFREIEENISAFMKGANSSMPDYGDWHDRFLKETDKLLDKNLKIKGNNLRNFRGMQIFVADRPNARLKHIYHSSKAYYMLKRFLNFFIGSARGGIYEAMDTFRHVKVFDFLGLLQKYPNPDIGNPLQIRYKGYRFTNRYIRHIYLLGMFKRYLAPRVGERPVVLDIGSSYGIFSSLIKQELPESSHILVDMPGQLMLAHYYLATLLPEAKIAGFKEVTAAADIDRNFTRKYDFVLVPTDMYLKIKADSVDVITNFSSFSEMKREWFDIYMASPAFKSAVYLFTINRYDAYPTYSNDITVLDYPFNDYDKILMRTCPFLKNCYHGRFLFLCVKKRYPSELFQFIGKRKEVKR